MDSGARTADSATGNSIFGRNRRRALRHSVHTPAYANLGGSMPGAVLELCEILDISERGACIQAASQMKPERLLPLCLDLSQTGAQVHVVGHVVWSDHSGKTGIRFPEMADISRERIHEWLEANSKAAPQAIAAPDKPSAASKQVPAQPKPAHAVAYTSLIHEWAEVQKEVEECGPDLGPALHLIAQRALILTWASGTAIALINKLKPSEMICWARSGTDSPEIGALLDARSGFSGHCIRSGSAITCDDTELDSRVDGVNCRALGVRSISACPVKRGREIIGILEVFSPEPAAFWENDITVLKKLAGFVALAVSQAEHARTDVLESSLGEDPESESDAPAPLDNDEELFAHPPSLRRKIALLLTTVVCITAVIWLMASWVANPAVDTSRLTISSSAHADSSREMYLTTDIKELTRFASQGDAAAEYALGKRYANGDGVKQDFHEATRWFLQAAEQGHVLAQSKLAASFWAGRGGPQDYSKAYFWALLAQAGGDETAPAIVMSCAPHLSPAQTAAEQKAAEHWLHSHDIGRSSDSI